MGYPKAKLAALVTTAALLAISCSQAPVDWQWVGGPPGPLTLTSASTRVAHGGSVVVTATGGVGHYTFTFDDGGIGGVLSANSDGNTATYVAPGSGNAAALTVTAKSGPETSSTDVTIPASGSLDDRCGDGGAGFRSFEICPGCNDTANAAVLRNGVLDMFGASAGGVPSNTYAVQSVKAADLSPMANQWGQATGALRINPNRSLNTLNAIVGIAAAPNGAVFYAGHHDGAGMLLGRLDTNGTQPSNFDGSSNTTRLFGDARYNPYGIGFNLITKRLGVAMAYQPTVAQDSVRMELFQSNGAAAGNTIVTYAAPLETNLPYVLALPDGKYLVPSASHDDGTLGVPRFTTSALLDTSWHPSGYRTMETQVALTPPWGPQAARLTPREVYLAGAKGTTIWINAMHLTSGVVRRSSLTLSGSGHIVTAVLPQLDGGALVTGYAIQAAISKGFIARFRRSSGGGLEPDTDAFSGFPALTDALGGQTGSDPYSFETAHLDAEGRILAVGWRSVSGQKSMFAACLFP